MSTIVRKLTEAESAELEPLLREVHAHFDNCTNCAESTHVETFADLATSGLCDVGQALTRRWLEWLEVPR